MTASLNGPAVLLLIALVVGLGAAAVRIGTVEHSQRRRREERIDRQARREWKQLQRDLAPRSIP